MSSASAAETFRRLLFAKPPPAIRATSGNPTHAISRHEALRYFEAASRSAPINPSAFRHLMPERRSPAEIQAQAILAAAARRDRPADYDLTPPAANSLAAAILRAAAKREALGKW